VGLSESPAQCVSGRIICVVARPETREIEGSKGGGVEEQCCYTQLQKSSRISPTIGPAGLVMGSLEGPERHVSDNVTRGAARRETREIVCPKGEGACCHCYLQRFHHFSIDIDRMSAVASSLESPCQCVSGGMTRAAARPEMRKIEGSEGGDACLIMVLCWQVQGNSLIWMLIHQIASFGQLSNYLYG
jgi:hypothetical protein